MSNPMQIIGDLLETEYKALIFINEERKIGSYSRCAKKITGILLENEQKHLGGSIEEGDIVIIADNELGNDDAYSMVFFESVGHMVVIDGGKAGFFEEANGGTIFLDEIGEIPQEIQVKLLHVLQNKRIYRVGSSKPIDVDVRVITATNCNLEEEVRKENFRQDLYYRIKERLFSSLRCAMIGTSKRN